MQNKETLVQDFREVLTDLKEFLYYQKDIGNKGFYLSSFKRDNANLYETIKKDGPDTSICEERGKTLQAIRKKLTDCKRCKLHFKRRNIVIGEGNEKAKLFFVGEAPGRDEDIKGKPFVGKAGQLLTRIINAIDLSREDVFISNIIKCRPPGNRNPEPDEIAACKPFLIKQIQVIKPHIICALGTFAAQTLLGTDEKISELRGRFHHYNGIKLIPTYHPAFLLRNKDFKRHVWKDMQMVQKEYALLTSHSNTKYTDDL
ncbi:MAG: uracil-DNA glycosylase [Thermodesulfobacteriota bacterium]|nr:uracil-DNA glycosylase [Thermodesulfobacteriota bacterium]